MADIILWEYQLMKAEQIIEEIAEHINQLTITGRHITVGNDIVHLPTFITTCTEQFICRVYTENELKYCSKFTDPYLRYASTWAAKEAVYKAIKQTDDTIKLWWKDIEISRAKAAGKPTVQIKKLKTPMEFSLSISHEADYVWAVAICLYEKK